VRNRRRVLVTIAVMLGCFAAGYTRAGIKGSGSPVPGSEIADALMSGIPGRPVSAATCRDTHVGDVTLCIASTVRLSGVRLRVTVRRVNPLSLLVDAEHHPPSQP
jgi:hypothetical protein